MSEHIFEKNEELSGILGQISYQLRGSLGNIHSALARLAPPELRDEDEKLDQDAAVLCQSYYRVLRLADNLSDAARLENPASTSRFCNGDIVEVCRKIMQQVRQPAGMLGIETAFRCGKTSHIIRMDKARMERLLLNLLSNAFKFIGQGEKQVSLEVRIEPEQVELVLSDTGCGIAPDRLETVFERYRHTQRLDPPPHGLGLGLPICRRIAEEHGGRLVLTSREGGGTTVLVSLPNRKDKVQRMGSYITDLGGGFNPILAGLADALPREAFTQKYLD